MNPNVRLDDHWGMEQNKQPIDTAQEPVDLTGDAEFMDTGVLYEDEDKSDRAAEGSARETWPPCTDKSCERKHPHAPVEEE